MTEKGIQATQFQLLLAINYIAFMIIWPLFEAMVKDLWHFPKVQVVKKIYYKIQLQHFFLIIGLLITWFITGYL